MHQDQNRQKLLDWSDLLTRAVALMTLGIPVLYVIGLAYDHGYQSVFRVPEVARAAGFHETLILGFFALHGAVRIINAWMAEHWQLMAVYAAVAGVLVACSLWRPESWVDRPTRHIRSWWRTHRNGAKSLVTASTSLFVFAAPYVLIALLYVLRTMPLLGYLVGKDVGRRNLSRHASSCEIAAKHPDKFYQCITAKGAGGESASGYLIASTSSYFVIAINGRTRAIPLDGWEFEAAYDTATPTQGPP